MTVRSAAAGCGEDGRLAGWSVRVVDVFTIYDSELGQMGEAAQAGRLSGGVRNLESEQTHTLSVSQPGQDPLMLVRGEHA